MTTPTAPFTVVDKGPYCSDDRLRLARDLASIGNGLVRACGGLY